MIFSKNKDLARFWTHIRATKLGLVKFLAVFEFEDFLEIFIPPKFKLRCIFKFDQIENVAQQTNFCQIKLFLNTIGIFSEIE